MSRSTPSAKVQRSRAAAAPAAAIPAFVLYGETSGETSGAAGAEAAPPAAEMLHIEEIQSRSRLYHWEIEPHVHHGLHQLIWLQAGSAEVALDASRQQCCGPGVIVVPPGVVHAFRFAPETDGLVLTLSPRSLLEGELPIAGDALRALFAHARVLPLDPLAADTQRLAGLFGELAAEFHAPGMAGSPVPLWLARAVVWRLAQLGAQTGSDLKSAGVGRAAGHRALFTRFVVLVEAHFLEHWPVARYASRLGTSTDRLNRVARAEAGMSALDLVHERLAREACRRLIYVAAPISKLAFELGFEDPAYFCRFFKRRTGCSPRQYRTDHAQ
ncbi:MAG: helix-turn-helix domain-containing protein [Leptothrix sp. (in: b-proteobacteria)]